MSATTRTFQIFKANHILLHNARRGPQKLYISLKVDGNFNLMINSAWIYVSNNLRLRPWKLVQKDLSRVWMISFLCLSSLSLSPFRNFIQSWVVWKEKNPNTYFYLSSFNHKLRKSKLDLFLLAHFMTGTKWPMIPELLICISTCWFSIVKSS